MENKQVEKIEFNVERDFGELFNVSFKFVKQNFKKFILTLIYLVGPFLLVTALLNGIYTSNSFDIQSIIKGGVDVLSIFSPLYFLAIIATIISSMVLVGVVCEYMVLYEEKGFDGFSIQDVWNAFKKDFTLILGTFFSLFLVTIVFVIVLGVVISLFFLMGTVGGVLGGLILIIGLLIFALPIAFVLTSIYIIRIRERLGFMEALNKARFLLKDNFWWAWVIMFIAYIIVSILSIVFVIPEAIVGILIGLSSINGGADDYSLMLIIFSAIGIFGTSILRSLLIIIVNFYYFSLNEQKEGSGVLSRINQIGSNIAEEDETTI